MTATPERCNLTPRGATTASRLAAQCRRESFALNPFRVAALPTEVSGRQLRGLRQQVLVRAAAGTAVAADAGLLIALDDLDRLPHRLTHELLAEWGTPKGCACDAGVHFRHDAAIRRYGEVLCATSGDRAEPALGWDLAAGAWEVALADDGLWAHLRHRVTVLADPRLGPDIVEGLQSGLGPALLDSHVTAALRGPDERILRSVSAWSFLGEVVVSAGYLSALGQARERALTILLGARSLGQRPALTPEVDTLATRVADELVPLGRVIEQADQSRTFAQLLDEIAVLANNLAPALFDAPTQSPLSTVRGLRLLTGALQLARRPETQQTVRANAAARTRVPARTRDRGDPAQAAWPGPGLRRSHPARCRPDR